MRSCEYLKSSHTEHSKRTKNITLGNIRAKLNEELLDSSAKNLAYADYLQIVETFLLNRL